MLSHLLPFIPLAFASADEGGGIHGDHQLFVGGNHPDLNLGVGSGDDHL